jgi:hypothetical protein
MTNKIRKYWIFFVYLQYENKIRYQKSIRVYDWSS